MHDGRIVENKTIKEVQKVEHVETSKYNKITIANKYRLGIRNTFNIITKFLLLFAVFLFISASLLSEYASFEQTEYEAGKHGYNFYFRDLSDNRIIIKKEDKSNFTKEDYEKISNIENIDYIVKDDLLLDNSFAIYNENDMYINGKMYDIKHYKGNLTRRKNTRKRK